MPNTKTLVFPVVKKTFLQMVGPSIIFMGMALSGGELLLWPNLVSNYGFSILWVVPIVLLLQFAVNIEIERYTLVTGKSVEGDLTSGVRWLAIVFALIILLALVWPAWITISGNLVAIIAPKFAIGTVNTGMVISVIALLLFILIFRNKQVYKKIETLSKISLLVALLIIVFVVIVKFDSVIFWEGLRGLFNWGHLPSNLPRFDFIAALAYGGVAGVLNLAQSEWIIEKGYGVNSTKINPDLINYNSKESKSNFKSWFKFINKEHFSLFFVANIVTIFLLTYLGRILLEPGSAQGFGVLISEIKILNQTFPGLGILFALSGIIIFFMANLTILDAAGRLTVKAFSPWKAKSKSLMSWIGKQKSSNVSITYLFIGILILLLSALVPHFKQPYFLLVTSACLSAFSMWLYPPLLVRMNNSLPEVTRPRFWRVFLVILASQFYGFITLWALSDYLPLWLIIAVAIVFVSYHGFILMNSNHLKASK